jgi:putative FmdB family regulatory protein
VTLVVCGVGSLAIAALRALALALTVCQGGHIATVMPTYEYGCTACGHEWEEIQRITEAPKEICPKCAQAKAHRLISGGTNFILKGGGWYSDLYSSQKPAAKKPDANGTTSTDGGAKAETKTESASETKSETKTEAKSAPSPAPGANPPAGS